MGMTAVNDSSMYCCEVFHGQKRHKERKHISS